MVHYMNMTKMLCNDVSGHLHDMYISCIMRLDKLRQKVTKVNNQISMKVQPGH